MGPQIPPDHQACFFGRNLQHQRYFLG